MGTLMLVHIHLWQGAVRIQAVSWRLTRRRWVPIVLFATRRALSLRPLVLLPQGRLLPVTLPVLLAAQAVTAGKQMPQAPYQELDLACERATLGAV